jgi:hypothetical protein
MSSFRDAVLLLLGPKEEGSLKLRPREGRVNNLCLTCLLIVLLLTLPWLPRLRSI